MNRQDIIRMAKEAGWDAHHAEFDTRIQNFAALVASAEREYLRESFRVVTAAEASAAILHEREACHALRQTLPNPYDHCQVSAHAHDMAIAAYGAAIRARGDV